MNVRLHAVSTALVLLVVPGAVVAQEAQEAVAPAQTAVAAQPVAFDESSVINMIVVKVNGTPIFLSELQTELESQLAVIRAQFPESEIDAQLPDLRRRLLAGMIDDRMMLQRADQLQITADANSVDRAMQNLREANNLTSDEEFAAALDAMGLTVEELREQMRTRIRQQQLAFQEVQRGIFVTESEIERYYEGNLEEFEAPEQLRLEQLVFVGGAELREQAVTALGELRGGATLGEVAARYPQASAFPTDERFVALTDLNVSLAAAVPDLATGTFSEPIQSQFGWHLVRVVERQERNVQPLDDVREVVRNRLTIEKSNARMDRYLGQLRDQTYLEILAPGFEGLEDLWRAAEETDVAAQR